MTEERLKEMQLRSDAATPFEKRHNLASVVASLRDVPELIEEVRRLRDGSRAAEYHSVGMALGQLLLNHVRDLDVRGEAFSLMGCLRR